MTTDIRTLFYIFLNTFLIDQINSQNDNSSRSMGLKAKVGKESGIFVNYSQSQFNIDGYYDINGINGLFSDFWLSQIDLEHI